MDAIPLRAFLDLLTQGVVRPRPVARRFIDARLTPRERWLLVALAAVMQLFFVTLVGVLTGRGGAGLAETAAAGVLVLAGQGVAYVATTALAFLIGRRFGGEGALPEIASAVAWYSVLGAALTPLTAFALGDVGPGGEIGGAAALSMILFGALNVWLLAACVAEAHRFRSTPRVAGATLAVSLALGLLLRMLMSLAVTSP